MLKYASTAVATLALCCTLTLMTVAQTDQSSDQSSNQSFAKKPTHQASSKHGAGKQALQGMKVPFTPGLLDKDGKVIPAVPDVSEFEGKEEGPILSPEALAAKAKA